MRSRSQHPSGTRRLRFEHLENRWLLSGVGGDPNIPELLGPTGGTTVTTPSVTLEFKPLPGYSGPYMVRLHDLQWNGQQAPGFRHDSSLHYLSVLTSANRISVPVRPGAEYRWWVHKPDASAAKATFSVDRSVVPPGAPAQLSPLDGARVNASFVTLEFQPLPGYSGPYCVRLHDKNWNGQQVPGFRHDSTAHYLSITTTATRVKVPVRPGATYKWWVHRPDSAAAQATFTTTLTPELIDGRYRCTSLAAWSDRHIDVSQAIQHCIDVTPIGATLELPAGRYSIHRQIIVNRSITITSVGKSLDDPMCVDGAGDCATLIASPALNEPWGMLNMQRIQSLHHIILDGNKQARAGTPAFYHCANGTNNRYGMTAVLDCDDAQIVGNLFKNALGGTALEVRQDHDNVRIENNRFASNGVHDRRNLWSDGLTIHGLTNSQIIGNEFVDNTDIDLILGGSQNCLVQGNRFYHTSSRSGGSFAALMIHKWPTRSADYSGTEISFNIIDGGPGRNVGTGIYVGSEGWYPGTPLGWSSGNPVRASIHHNEVRNTKSGMYVAAEGFAIFDNQFSNAHGVSFPSSGRVLTSSAPIVVSPTAADIDFHGADQHPATRSMFEYQSWINCIPHWAI